MYVWIGGACARGRKVRRCALFRRVCVQPRPRGMCALVILAHISRIWKVISPGPCRWRRRLRFSLRAIVSVSMCSTASYRSRAWRVTRWRTSLILSNGTPPQSRRGPYAVLYPCRSSASETPFRMSE